MKNLKLICGATLGIIAASASADIYTWDSFTSASGDANYATSSDADASMAMLFNFGSPGSAMVAGSGNIYGMGGPLQIHAYAYTYDGYDVNSVTVDLTGLGTPFDTYNALLIYETSDGDYGSLGTDMASNFESMAGGEGWGAYESTTWTWDLTSVEGNINALAFMIESMGAHTSLDSLTMDIDMVPAPGALALLGMAGIATRRRRS